MKIEYLSKPLAVGAKTAPNRLVYQPTESNNCDQEGSPTKYTLAKYAAIARGGPGIIHIESIDVTLKTQARSNRMLLLDRNLQGLEALVAEIRKANREALVIFQLSHAGRLSDPKFRAPMYVYPPAGAAVKAMSTAEVEEAREEFVAAAVRAWKVGADGVDFKQAHSFLGDDFLHPANTRGDRYGGSWENRTRFFRESLKRIREEVRDRKFLVGSRISPYEAIPGGFGTSGPEEVLEDLAEPLAYARLMQQEGVDFINVSAGSVVGNLELLMPTSNYPEGVLRHFGWTRAIKQAVSIPVIGSGYSRLADGDNSLHVGEREKAGFLYWAEKNLRDGNVDLVGVGRQAIADPDFARKVLGGQAGEVRWCTTCNQCITLLVANQRIGCPLYEPEYRALLPK
jgi:2,4-dienoyl-CoA reductase-like NADH-dependent reductase (Old Yellow Enzyme family)